MFVFVVSEGLDGLVVFVGIVLLRGSLLPTGGPAKAVSAANPPSEALLNASILAHYVPNNKETQP